MSKLKRHKPERLEIPEEYSLNEGQFFAENNFQGLILGVDEVGRGPLAGPVVAAAVILPMGEDFSELDDSKKLTEKKREELFPIIKERALAYAIAEASEEEIDRINILNATFLAMRRCLDQIVPKHEVAKILVDGNHLIREVDPEIQKCVIKGDGRVSSIAAASILAKVTRDRHMQKLHEKYPQYAWSQNKGYGSKAHRLAIQKTGLSPYHRKSFGFKPVEQTDLFE